MLARGATLTKIETKRAKLKRLERKD